MKKDKHLSLLADILAPKKHISLPMLIQYYQNHVLHAPDHLVRERHGEMVKFLNASRERFQAQHLPISLVYASLNRCIKAHHIDRIRKNISYFGYPHADKLKIEQLYLRLVHELSEPSDISELLEGILMCDDYIALDFHRTRHILRFLLRQKDLKRESFKLLQAFYELCARIDERRQYSQGTIFHQFLKSMDQKSRLAQQLKHMEAINKGAEWRASIVKGISMFLLSFTVIEPTTMLAEAISGVFLSSTHTIAYVAYFSTIGLGIIFSFILIKATFKMCEDALLSVYRQNLAKPHFDVHQRPIQASDYYYSKFIYGALAVIESLALLLFINNSLKLFAKQSLMAMGPTVWIPVVVLTGIEALGLVLTMMVTDIYPIMGYFRQRDYEDKLQHELCEPDFLYKEPTKLQTLQWHRLCKSDRVETRANNRYDEIPLSLKPAYHG